MPAGTTNARCSTAIYAAELRTKISTFRQVTDTRKATMLTLVSPYGSVPNAHQLELVVNDVTTDVLFD